MHVLVHEAAIGEFDFSMRGRGSRSGRRRGLRGGTPGSLRPRRTRRRRAEDSIIRGQARTKTQARRQSRTPRPEARRRVRDSSGGAGRGSRTKGAGVHTVLRRHRPRALRRGIRERGIHSARHLLLRRLQRGVDTQSIRSGRRILTADEHRRRTQRGASQRRGVPNIHRRRLLFRCREHTGHGIWEMLIGRLARTPIRAFMLRIAGVGGLQDGRR